MCLYMYIVKYILDFIQNLQNILIYLYIIYKKYKKLKKNHYNFTRNINNTIKNNYFNSNSHQKMRIFNNLILIILYFLSSSSSIKHKSNNLSKIKKSLHSKSINNYKYQFKHNTHNKNQIKSSQTTLIQQALNNKTFQSSLLFLSSNHSTILHSSQSNTTNTTVKYLTNIAISKNCSFERLDGIRIYSSSK